jgi:hypothetical protein
MRTSRIRFAFPAFQLNRSADYDCFIHRHKPRPNTPDAKRAAVKEASYVLPFRLPFPFPLR